MTYISDTDGGATNVRSPRVWLSLGGTRLPCITATVTRKSEGEADTFVAELAVDETAEAGFGYAEWADFQPVDAEILISLDGGNPKSIITGQIDEPRIHWGEGTVTVAGRDKSASLTEKRRSEQFKNQKSGDIVSKIAQDHGLTPQVNAGSDFAGKIYDVDTVHLLMNLSDHEILTRLAEREACRWYVDGTTLTFEPIGTETDVYGVLWVPPDGKGQVGKATVLDLETHRNMSAARPHSVAVRSWHHRDAKKYDGVNLSSGVGQTVEIEHHHNGRNQSQVDKLSKSRLKDAIRHDCNVVVKAALDLDIDPRQKMELSGTGTIFDQLYDIDSVEISISWQGGSEMSIAGKVAKSGRSGTDDTGETKFVPLPPERPASVTPSDTTPVTTPSGSGGIGSA